MAAPAAAGSAALVIDGYRKAAGHSPAFYVVKAALANTARRAFEGPITGLISSIKSNRLGMDPATLFPPRNTADVGVTGEGAGRIDVPDAILASTVGVVAYTPGARGADGNITTNAFQPSWSLNDLGPGQTASQTFVLRGGDVMAPATTPVTFAVEPGHEANGVHSAPASWFTLPDAASATKGTETPFTTSLAIPQGTAPGQYTATIIATTQLAGGVTEHLRIPVQLFIRVSSHGTIEAPIWASDITDYSIVGFENPLGQIYTDWTSIPVRVPEGVSTMTMKVWDPAGASTMDLFVFDNTGNEISSTVTNDPLHAIPTGNALTPTSADSPGVVTLAVGTDVKVGDILWLTVSDTKPATPSKFETYHLALSTS